MEPIPETSEAIEEYGPFLDNGDLVDQLRAMATRVEELVPSCVGLSLAYREHGVTFTLVASDEVIGALDAMQYVDNGPCVAALAAEEVQEYAIQDMLAEGEWQLFAQASAAAGIASTLTLPILVDEQVVGTVNLYAATPDAFAGHHDEVAAIFSAWAPGAVANADLTFETRRTAQAAPAILLDEMRIQVAVGILVVSERVSVATARVRLREAAERAGVSETTIARAIIDQAAGPDR